MTESEQTRATLTGIDRELLRLFEQRMQAVAGIAAYRQERGLPARNADAAPESPGAVSDPEIAEYAPLFLQRLSELSARYQTRLQSGMRIAYCGAEGAFAFLAAGRLFSGSQRQGYPDFSKAYTSVESGECDCAVLPLENSSAGEVGAVLDLLYSGSLYVNRVAAFPVRHCLLANPGTRLSDIRTVLSHPQALMQCAGFLNALNAEAQEAANTALAAKTVRESGDPSLAAIASEEAAAHFGLTVLRGDISDRADNATRFAVLSRVPNRDIAKENPHFLLFFTVPDRAGALVQALNILGVHGYNLCRLRSRPMKGLTWHYYFYVEAEGDPQTTDGQAMLRELNTLCGSLKLVGVFPADDSP